MKANSRNYSDDIFSKKYLREKYFLDYKKYPETLSGMKDLRRNLYSFLYLYLSPFNGKRKMMIYHSMKSEPSVNLITQNFSNIEWYYPEYYRTKLYPTHSEKRREAWEMEFIIVPGLYVDDDGYRLGRGGGFYDRLLSFYPVYRTIFVGYHWQRILKVPREKHDRKVGYIITDKRILKT